MNFKHEYNSNSNHRIVWIPKTGKETLGEWVGYQVIASLNHAGKSAIAITDYHAGGALEPNRIYFVEAQ
jgi:hypothetical protein